jgi:hypothetical protein
MTTNSKLKSNSMVNFYVLEEGNFSHSIFAEKVTEAQNRIVSENNLLNYEFNIIRNSISIELSTNGRVFQGQYMTYEILNNGNLIGHLDCFMDHQATYIDITTKSL